MPQLTLGFGTTGQLALGKGVSEPPTKRRKSNATAPVDAQLEVTSQQIRSILSILHSPQLPHSLHCDSADSYGQKSVATKSAASLRERENFWRKETEATTKRARAADQPPQESHSGDANHIGNDANQDELLDDVPA